LSLRVPNSFEISPEITPSIARHQNLRTLHLDGVKGLSESTNLHTILFQMNSLTSLSLSGSDVTNLDALKMLHNLEVLNLSRTRISNEKLLPLSNLPIELLDLSYTRVQTGVHIMLSELPKLTTLKLAGTRVTTLPLPEQLSRNIHSLDFSYSRMLSKQWKLLEECPRLISLHWKGLLGERLDTKAITSALSRFSLIELHLGSSFNINDDVIADIIPYLSELEVLDLSATSISNNSLILLCALPNLQSLNLSNTAITCRGLVHLAQMTTLKHLDLSRTNLKDVEQLYCLPLLRTLNLGRALSHNTASNVIGSLPSFITVDAS